MKSPVSDITRSGPTGQAPEAAEAAHANRPARRERPALYLAVVLVAMLAGLGSIWRSNMAFAPEMYDPQGSQRIAEALAKGRNYATFDLNVNIREIRDHQISRLPEAPELVILGASQWQEAHVGLIAEKRAINAHVHRDYWEDMLGMVEMFVRHNKLPRQMIIAVRDLQFMPTSARTDYLWLPIVPYYEAMSKRLGIKPQPFWHTAPVQRWRELVSLPMLHTNVLRWYEAPLKPHETSGTDFEGLDVLMSDGSILWSQEHKRFFTQKRARDLSLAFAKENFNKLPPMDPDAIAAVDALLAFLKTRGVDVYFVHPPFNPIYWEAVQGSPYLRRLAEIEQLVQNLAAKHDFRVFGNFNPHKVGCTSDMYIDAEHSNPDCLAKVFDQFRAVDRLRPVQPNTTPADAIASLGSQEERTVAAMTTTAASVLSLPTALPRRPLRASSLRASDPPGAGSLAPVIPAVASRTERLAPRTADHAVVVEPRAHAVSASQLIMIGGSGAKVHRRSRQGAMSGLEGR